MRATEFAELRAFAEVAARRSFSRAAEHLRVSPSTLSQTVRALEERIGVTLLTRTTRHVAPTSAGERLLQRFAPALEQMEAALSEARDGRVRPTGTVRLHAPRPAYLAWVEPVLGRLQEVLPDVTLDLSIDDAPAEAVVGAHDLAIRRAAFVDGDTVALDLGGDLRHVVVASPGYLTAHGEPLSPDALSQHRCIRWRPIGGELQGWRFQIDGRPEMVAVNGTLIVSHCDAAVAASLRGVGIAYVLESHAAGFIAKGQLAPLLAAHLPPSGGWKLCHLKHVRLTAAARAVAELLTGPT